MRTFIFGLAAAVIGTAACTSEADGAGATTASGGWTVDKEASELSFTATQTGKQFKGTFSKYDATIIFDPANLADARIEVVVDMTSARSGDRQRDAALPTSDWFSIKTFPTATFASTEVVDKGGGAHEAQGTLKIRDVSRAITLPFNLAIKDDHATADGTVTIVRTDYGVGQGEFSTGQWVGLEVGVTYHIEATR